jgi:cell division protein FtsI (penicillin-binding protein 3)
MGVVEKDYESFYEKAQKYKTIMPNVVGMPAMDALVLLENMQVNVKVRLEGNGLVKAQSINKNTKLKDNQTVVLKAS